MPRLGLIARADKTGLGYQTKAYYKWLKPDETMVINMKPVNGTPAHKGWYQNAFWINGFPDRNQIKSFLKNIDVLLTAESPYNYELYTIARQMNVRTVCVYNPEFFDYFAYPQNPQPDVLINPSKWKYDEIDQWCMANGVEHYQIHHPVDLSEFPYTPRRSTKTLHIAGKPATEDRNGTMTYLRAIPNGKVTTQSEEHAKRWRMMFRHSNIYSSLASPQEIYRLGDILVLPRKYGGNCLPLNEALASGMPVVMPDIEPNDNILPQEWLTPAHKIVYFEPRTKVDIFDVNVEDIRKTVQWFEGRMEQESQRAYEIAKTISWETLLKQYEGVLYENNNSS